MRFYFLGLLLCMVRMSWSQTCSVSLSACVLEDDREGRVIISTGLVNPECCFRIEPNVGAGREAKFVNLVFTRFVLESDSTLLEIYDGIALKDGQRKATFNNDNPPTLDTVFRVDSSQVVLVVSGGGEYTIIINYEASRGF